MLLKYCIKTKFLNFLIFLLTFPTWFKAKRLKMRRKIGWVSKLRAKKFGQKVFPIVLSFVLSRKA